MMMMSSMSHFSPSLCCLLLLCLCFMDVNPFGGKAAIEELVPADLLLAFNEEVVDFGIMCGGDGGCWPIGKTMEKK